jgi:hypothetical protein
LVLSTDKSLNIGRALYPTYYRGAAAGSPPGSPKYPPNISRLEFTQIGPRGNIQVVLPVISSQQVKGFKNNSDVLVVGCQNSKLNNIDAIAVVVLGTKDTVYLRSPAQPLSCTSK